MAHSATALDYDAADTLVVSEPAQLRALGDEVRGRIVALLRERAASASELAELLGMPKGTVGHHLQVLESAGLIHVVRTRRVRAVTEKYYGRVARLFMIKTEDERRRRARARHRRDRRSARPRPSSRRPRRSRCTGCARPADAAAASSASTAGSTS